VSRIIYYANSLVTSKQLSQSQIFATEELGMFMQAIIGKKTGASGLPCTPSTGLSVDIGAGAIFAQAPIDNSSIGSFPANSNAVVKIATHFTPTNFLLYAPNTMGHSINYLIEGNFLEKDDKAEVVEYYNPDNPKEPFYGLGTDHRPQYTIRRTSVSLNMIAGVSALTRTQVTPEATIGWTPLYVITISAGQTFVDPDNIVVAPNANFIEGIYNKFASIDNSIANAYTYINHVNNVFVNSTTVSSTQINDLYSKFGNATSQIFTLNQTFANSTTAMSTQINQLSSKIDNSTATIENIAQTVATSNRATATQINHLSAQLLDTLSKSDILQINQTISETSRTLATQINTLDSRFGAEIDNVNATIREFKQTEASNNAALAQSIVTLNANVGTTNARISTLESVVATNNSATSSYLLSLTSSIGNTNARVSTLETAAATNNSSTASYLLSLNANIASTNARIDTLETVVATNNSATASYLLSLNANVGTTNARISTLETAVATNNSAQADSISSLSATVGNLSASVTTLQSASANNGFSTAAWGLTVQAGNIITGMQAISNSTGTSEFNILASSFSVSDPNSSAKFQPLTYKNGTLTIGNCVVDGDLIVNGSIKTNAIAPGAISNLQYTSGNGSGSSQSNIGSLTIVTSGYPCVVVAYYNFKPYKSGSSFVGSIGQLTMDGGVVGKNQIMIAQGRNDLEYQLTINLMHTPTSGTHTYSLVSADGYPSTYTGWAISVTELKR